MSDLRIDTESVRILQILAQKSKRKILKLVVLVNQKKKTKSSIRAIQLCKILDINTAQLFEIFRQEGLNILFEAPQQKIQVDQIYPLIKKIEEIQSELLNQKIYDKNIKELIVCSDPIIEFIESEKDNIRLSKLAKFLNLGINHICKLFEKENIILECNPNTNVSCDLLKHIILRESELSISNSLIDNIIGSKAKITSNKRRIKELEKKIESLDSKAYSKSVILNQFVRNEYVREYAKLRANGICELCENAAPFVDVYGAPFLETHHVVFLSKGGEDTIQNVVALCPNCHRKIHNLNLEEDVKKLREKLNKVV